MLNCPEICSVQGVLEWEGLAAGDTVEIHASLDHESAVIVEEDSPATKNPAADSSSKEVSIVDVVPPPDGEALNESGLGRSDHDGGDEEERGGNGLFVLLVHLLK